MKEMIEKYIINFLTNRGYYIYKTPKIIDSILPDGFYNCKNERCLYVDSIINNTIQNLYVYEGEKKFRRKQIISCIKQIK